MTIYGKGRLMKRGVSTWFTGLGADAWQKFCRKLHENERNWFACLATPPPLPLDPPLVPQMTTMHRKIQIWKPFMNPSHTEETQSIHCQIRYIYCHM